MKTRIITAVIGIAAVVGLIYFLPPAIFNYLITLFCR